MGTNCLQMIVEAPTQIDACLAVWADWEETGVSILGQSSTKGGGFTYHSLLTQVRDKKVLLCMCVSFSQAIRRGNEDGKR